MPISKKLALTDEQLNEIMTTSWNCRIATAGPGKHINLTPMWFGWAGNRVYIYGRGQKVVNLRRDSNCTVLVDRNEKFPELQAVMLQGIATVLETKAAEDADSHLADARVQMGAKYNGGHGKPPVENPGPNTATARGDNGRWMVLEVTNTVTWDNYKLVL